MSLFPTSEPLNVQLTYMSEMKSAAIEINGSSIGDFLLNCDNGSCELLLKSDSDSEKLAGGENWLKWLYAVPEVMACWIATGVNMLCRAGVFPVNEAQTIYEILADKYYEKYHRLHYMLSENLPAGGNVRAILQTFIKGMQYCTPSNTNTYSDELKRWLPFCFSSADGKSKTIQFKMWSLLLHLNNKWCVSSLAFKGHVITIL